MCDSDHAHVLIEQTIEVVHEQLPAFIDLHNDEFSTSLLAQELPRHDVRVVLEMRNQDFVAVANRLRGLANEVNGWLEQKLTDAVYWIEQRRSRRGGRRSPAST